MTTHKTAAPEAQTKHASGVGAITARFELWPVWIFVAFMVLLHLLTNSRFGFYKDELQFLADARNLDWGFIECPPLTPFFARVSTSLFGLSLVGLRVFPVLIQAMVLILTALMTRELGGKRPAIIVAVLAIGLSVFSIFDGTIFEYTSFDYLWWVLIAYFIIRLLKSENPRWWLAIGAIEGLGLLTKYSIVFLIAGLLCGLVLSPARRYLFSGWFWSGHLLALAIFSPNILWQFQHHFVSFDFLRSIHARDVAIGATNDYLAEQLLSCINPFATPLFIVGIIAYLRGQRYRTLGWMYLAPLLLFTFMRGRSYYLAPAYPMLMAMGAVAIEQWIYSSSRNTASAKEIRRRSRKAELPLSTAKPIRQWTGAVFMTGMALWGIFACAIILPLHTRGPLRSLVLRNSEALRDEFGWDELVRTVAGIRDGLPAEQQTHLGILTRDYGEQGAITVLGEAYHLPPALSTINSAWLHGYPSPPPTSLIVVGFGSDEAAALFAGCHFAAHTSNAEGVTNEESKNHPNIFLCGPPRSPWPVFWNYSPRFE